MSCTFANCGIYTTAFFAVWSLLIVCTALLGVILTLKQGRPAKVLIPELLLLALCEISEKIFMTCPYAASDSCMAISLFKKLPVFYAAVFLTALSAGVSIFLFRRISYSKTHISNTSIKESFDSLPTGICFYYENGFVGLINDKMNEISMELTGRSISNGGEFWSFLQRGEMNINCLYLRYGENPIIRCSNGKIYRFTQYIEFEDGRKLFEIIADDITELYKKTEQLRKNHEELQEQSKRLLKYSQNIMAEVRERETLNAKIKMHDNINRLLLATRRCIEDHGGTAERAKIFSLWHGGILVFSDREDKNPLKDLLEASKLLGIELEFKGEMPREIVRQNVITLAAAECMTNAVRHAEAKKLIIELSQNKVIITNDGTAPYEAIHEGGGLSTVRKKIEELHGEMFVRSTPEFKLILNFPG